MRKVRHISVFILVSALAIVFLFPFYVAVLMAFKSPQETYDAFYALPAKLDLANFAHAWDTSHYPTAFMNSLIITVVAIGLIVTISAMAGYSIARRNKKFYQMFFVLFLAGMMVPFQITMLPIYKLGKTLHMIDTHWGIILIYGGAGIQMGVLFYTGFIRAISREIEEAATIDGCSTPGIFFRIILPLLKPVTATVLVLNALYIWNDFLLPLLFLQDASYRTIPLQQYFFFGQYSSDLNLAFAYAVMGMVPIIVFFLFMQKYIIKGIAAGAVKG
ncbi:raffinose/stachyose/melibiose transport system permease protein [Paenibacillus endophyticus]|uniref:Raffinose/stachyose/melibiose transport system permease protein n=1 Tax=Paenibacillus endophyticus TaxID=1294268 RepID=A0A7W5G892_9BACL|nr:carbohydrate ABC transporter permease [Paenibacillus endophyticus]MBB3150819.1 raffinose/stachyose/melibiose transport system permease protein [Paenibacillus endophyticus]